MSVPIFRSNSDPNIKRITKPKRSSSRSHLVFLSGVPLHLTIQNVINALSNNIGVTSVQPTSPGNYAIELEDNEQRENLINSVVLPVGDQVGNFYDIPVLCEGEFPNETSNTQPQENITCPVCYENINTMNEEDRQTHVLACLGTTPMEKKLLNKYDLNDEELFDPPYTDFSPFGVICPYINCQKQYEASDFPNHVAAIHKNDPIQAYACPICDLESDTPYKTEIDTNLSNHLIKHHSNMMMMINDLVSSPKPVKRPEIYAPIQPGDHVVEICQETITSKDCGICYEIYNKGDYISRLPCLCVYHQKCIEAWFMKKNQRNCPLHTPQ